MNQKLLTLTLLACILCSIRICAQTNIAIGTGSTANNNTTYPCPLQDYNEGSRAQYLYRSAELTAAGMTAGAISAVKFNVTSLGSFKASIEEFTIKIGSTATASLNAAAWETVPSINYYGPFNYVPSVGLNTFTLSSPFIWDGTSNIIIEICNGAGNNLNYTTNTNNPLVSWTTGLTFNGSHTNVGNNLANLCGTGSVTNTGTQTTRPNIVFAFTSGTVCSGTPSGGTAVSSLPAIVCSETLFLLDVTGGNAGSGFNYQWESSPDNAAWTKITGATTPVYQASQSASAWYRRITTCSNGGATAASAPVLVSNVTAVSGIFSINSSMPSGNNNFQSFNAAYNYIKCGINGPVVFNVQPGSNPYTEQLTIFPIPGASATNTVTFNGNGATLAFSSSYNNNRPVIKLDGADHIRFDSLVVDATYNNNGGNYGWGIQLIRDADSNVIKRCTITASVDACIVVGPSDTRADAWDAAFCDSNYIGNNTINALGAYYGISICGSSNDPVLNNTVVNNKILDFNNTGIYLAGNYAAFIDGNDITRPNRKNGYSFQGIRLESLNAGITVSNNRIHDPFIADPLSTADFIGIYFNGSDAYPGIENKVINNLIYNVNGLGLQYGLYNNGSDGAFYFHNTVSLDNINSVSPSPARAFYQNGTASGLRIIDNIFSVARGGTGIKHAIYMQSSGTSFISNRNNYFVTSGTNNYVGYLSGDRNTLASFQAATKQDSNSLSVNPYFTDLASANLVPRSDLLDNMGSNVGVTKDITGAARSVSTPDIGAYEFTLPSCITPPNAGAAVAVPNSGLCLGVPVKLSLTGQTSGAGQRIQWQYSTTATGTYANLGVPMLFADTTIFATTTLYFRAAITCGGNTVLSAPVLVSVNPPFLSGVYTIDPGLPVSASNFQTFTDASAALNCGITGSVTFNVAPGTYTEQVRVLNIAGASPSSRITFQSASGVPASVILKFAATNTSNYVLKLDTASYITFKNISMTNTATSYGRVIEMTYAASYDSIQNCIITTPPTTDGSDARAAIYAGALTGTNNVIKGNTILNGSTGIFLRGYSNLLRPSDNIIDSNRLTGGYYQGIYTQYHKRISASGNDITLATTLNGTIYGINADDCDSSFRLAGNSITISSSGRTSYGISIVNNDASPAARGFIGNNSILAVSGNTADLKGMHIRNCRWYSIVNNIINIKTTGNNSYGLHSQDGGNNSYWNNTVYNKSTSTGNNYAAFFEGYYWSGNSGIDARNNIFANGGTGRALGTTDFGYNGTGGVINTVRSDYNMLYTSGSLLASSTAPVNNTYTSLQAWRNATKLDLNSIVYKPAFISDTDLSPNLADSTVWAMNGRGMHIPGNNVDRNNNTRPVTLSQGVPDLGAYEFAPVSVPVALVPVPAVPLPGDTQTFMMGTDTVMKIAWPATGNVPQSVILRRYSGAKPAGLSATVPFMYFYTDAEMTGASPYSASVEQFYLDPWLGTINNESGLKMAQTNSSGTWVANPSGNVNEIKNTLKDTAVTYFGKFTGLPDPVALVPVIASPDSSNMGTSFWVGYGHHVGFNRFGNDQDMVLYFAAQQRATVTVKINGTSWVRTYSVPANTVFISDSLPKTGSDDARLNGEGLFNRGISITSDVPITATTRIGSFNSTGASLLLPVGSYGYDYRALTLENVYGDGAYSWAYVVAAYNNTVVEITPSNPTLGGRAANVPFTVTLNKGDVYNIMGANYPTDNTFSYDMTGTRFRSLTNTDGKCLPFAVFSGSSHTKVNCTNYPVNTGSSDNYIQQNFPTQAWGHKYLLTPTSLSTAADTLTTNIFKVVVKDPGTVVKRNGVLLPATSLINNFYYQFESNEASYIEADKPVTVAQYTSSSNACDLAYGAGNPEMIYLSPLEQGIKKAVLFRTSQPSILQQYVTLSIPTAGLTSLKIDNRTAFSKTYTVPSLPGYTVVIQRWDTTGGAKLDSTIIIESDSAFTAITYGLGWNKTYGYNAGTLIKNLNALPSINNTNNTTGSSSSFTCVKSPFRISTLVNFKPQIISWKISSVNNITPAADVTQVNATPDDSSYINGSKYYRFTIPQDYVFSAAGSYTIPVIITDPSIDGCSNTFETQLTITVKGAPIADFAFTYTGCSNDSVHFSGIGSNSGLTVNRWAWDFADTTFAAIQNPLKRYATAGVKNVNLRVITIEGCIADTIKPVTVKPIPVVSLAADSLTICPGANGDTLRIVNPLASVTYNWYTTATGGTPVFSGTRFPVDATGVFYAEGALDGCNNRPRVKAVVNVYPPINKPVVTVDSAGVTLVRFRWNAVPGAVSYAVSTDAGATFINPDSGPAGLTHTVSPLVPLASASIIVRANGLTACQNSVSQLISGRTLPDQVYIPNVFTPNGDGRNDVWLVYGYIIRSIRVSIFNQWGQKIFVTTNQQTGWDGTNRGKQQPVGVYLYVVEMKMSDGSVVTRKGSINLVR